MSTPTSPRIVSLLPSASEILNCLGLMPYVVGRSHECDYPTEVEKRPICTAARLNSDKSSGEIDRDVQQLLYSALGIYEVKLETLKALNPTHIVTQDQCDVCAVTLDDVKKAVDAIADTDIKIISLQPNILADVYGDINRVAEEFNVDAETVLESLQQRVVNITKQISSLNLAQRPKVAAIEWIDPLMGGGNWLPELVELAGGDNVLGRQGHHSPYINWDKLREEDPDIVIVLPCGFDGERTRQEMLADVKQHPQWLQLRAVQNDHLYICDGNAYFNRPGPRLVDSLEILAEIIHPQLFKRQYPEQAWQKLTFK